MRDLIDINTDTILSLVSTMQLANDAIDSATAKLKSITQHEEWNCKERDIINEYIASNAVKAKQLQSRSTAFLAAIKVVANQLVTEESNISSLFDSVEELIKSIGALSSEKNTGNITTQVSDVWQQIALEANAGNIKNMNPEAIKVWNIQDIDL